MNNFHIGHSESDTQTLLPNFVKETSSQCIFGDIAGFNESMGPMYEMYNIFIMKLIFNYAQHLRFIIPMSLS